MAKINSSDSTLPIQTWVFDLDNTLYPANCDLFSLISQRMTAFIAKNFDLSTEDARARQRSYFQKHGTTLRGLMTEHGTPPGAFLDFVHDIDLSRVQPSPVMARALSLLPGRKYVFTNASKGYSEKVLARLGIETHIDGIFDIEIAGFAPKPDPATYRKMIDYFSVDPEKALMVEDMARNLPPAAALGMKTAWVPNDAHWSQEGSKDLTFDFVIEDLPLWLHELALRGGRLA